MRREALSDAHLPPSGGIVTLSIAMYITIDLPRAKFCTRILGASFGAYTALRAHGERPRTAQYIVLLSLRRDHNLHYPLRERE